MDFFNQLPRPAQASVALLTGSGIVGSMYYFSPTLAAFLGIGAVVLAVAIAAFYSLKAWAQRRRANTLVGDLQQQSTATPQSISDAEKRAKLDSLRQKFSEGLTKFGDIENVYRFPWYLVVGEPGGGKSEAIRRCGVGFPPGMQDEMQGVGGTINMNWWFSNHAVFLDTAGRLMFEEVRAGETNEWREFLQLLTKNRKNCPINGLLLVIPANNLIMDSEAKMHEKAGRIAQQFELIQRTLDIRFPVFVLVTKCDLFSGFREFFEDFSDAQSQQQMLGWVNPLDRDAPFQPELVTEHIETVVKRIKKRRLSLLRDPIPQKGMERRADEVDALFALPQSFQLMAPRLRAYLEKVFVAGPWSPKPLFLRGIFFTSSMREGQALDQELAEALGVQVDRLPEGRSWERERAYFLRDLFTEKVFKEKGLVTRASNTRKMLRTRSIVVWGTASALALTFAGLTWYGGTALKKSIGEQSSYWEAGTRDWREPGVWHPIVEQGSSTTPSGAVYRGDDKIKLARSDANAQGGDVPLMDYHAQLRKFANVTFGDSVSIVFWPILRWYDLDGKNNDRQRAQRILFEGSVMSPILKEARRRMLFEDVNKAPDKDLLPGERLKNEAVALAALLRVESEALPTTTKNLDSAGSGIVEPLLDFARAPSLSLETTQLVENLKLTYGSGSSGQWMPVWLALRSDDLATNKPISNGLARFRTLAEQRNQEQITSIKSLKETLVSLRLFRKIEKEMDENVSGGSGNKISSLNDLCNKLENVTLEIDAQVKNGVDSGLYGADGQSSIKRSYDRLVEGSQKQNEEAFAILENAATPFTTHALFRQVVEELASLKKKLKSDASNLLEKNEQTELTEFDSLLQFYDNKRQYRVLWEQYKSARQEYSTEEDKNNAGDNRKSLIGQNWVAIDGIKKVIDGKRNQLEVLAKNIKSPFNTTCRYYLDQAYEKRIDFLIKKYVLQSKSLFVDTFFAPLVSESGGQMSEEAVNSAGAYLNSWSREIGSDRLKDGNATTVGKLQSFALELQKINIEAALKYLVSKGDYDKKLTKAENALAVAEKSTISVTIKGASIANPGPRIWRYVNGHNIGDGASYTKSCGFGGELSFKFTDFEKPTKTKQMKFDAAKLIDNKSVEVDGVTLDIEVTPSGEDPRPIYKEVKDLKSKAPSPPPAPKKRLISSTLD